MNPDAATSCKIDFFLMKWRQRPYSENLQEMGEIAWTKSEKDVFERDEMNI